jgi:hypothetical protein
MEAATKQLAVALSGTPFIDSLITAGLIPDNCRRFAIDGTAGKPIVITYETYVDERINGDEILDGIARLGK